MNKKMRFVMLGVMALAVITPFFASALDPLVQCGTSRNPTPCSLCDLFSLTQTIINFCTLYAAPLIAVLVFAWGGFKILISGANPGYRQEGIKAIRNGVIGLLIVFSAWVVVNEFLLFFADKTTVLINGVNVKVGQVTSFNPWTKINCYPAIKPVAPAPTAPAACPAYDETGTERTQLMGAHIGVKTNYCCNFNKPYTEGAVCCTTVAQLPSSAITGLISLKNECRMIMGSDCMVYVTGGTEKICHVSHGPGNPVVDLQLNNTLNFYMFSKAGGENNFTQSSNPCGRIYTITGISFVLLEYDDSTCTTPNHWHLKF